MFCIFCGKQIQDGSKFCPYCGGMLSSGEENPASGAPAYTPPEAGGENTAPRPDLPAGGMKRRGRGLIIGGAVALVLVVAVIVAAVSGLFASPKGKVERALAKTSAAYAQAIGKMGVPNLSQLAKSRSYSQSLSVEIGSINRDLFYWYDLSALKGAGIRVNTDFDQKGRKIGVDAAVTYDDEDLASVQLLVNNDMVTFASPELTRGEAYGLSTETLGADLYELGVDDSEINVKKISFNVFDLLDKAASVDEREKEMTKALARANKELLGAIEVDKSGKKSVQVNGKRMDAVLYDVVIPKSAMRDYASALVDALKMADTQDMTKDILQSMGFDKAAVSRIMSDMGDAGAYDDLDDSLKEIVKAIGSVELEVYVSGGRVVKVEYSGSIDGMDVDAELQLGGGENYVDDLSLEISAGGDKLTVESSGSHAGKGGVFTDETVIRSGSERITSELRWEPKADKNNFEWELKSGSTASVSMEGRLTTTKSSVSLHLEDLSVKAAGSRMVSLQADYSLGPCKGVKLSHSSPKLLSDLDKDDLDELEENFEDWLDDLTERFTALDYIL